MRALTPSERRGALIVVVLLVLGAARDLVVARLAPRTPAPRIVAEAPWPAPAPVPEAAEAPPAPQAATPRLDLNQASADQLDALPGIGPVLAHRILDHRQRAGPFRSVDELRAVRGVGPRLFERLRTRVTVAALPRGAGSKGSERVQSARERTSGAADSAQVHGRAFR